MKGNDNSKKIVFLTDDLISMYSRDNVLTTYGDAVLRRDYPVAVKGGPYDPTIFGSMFTDSCNCGRTTAPGVLCPKCGTKLLDKQTAFSRYARIESPVMYCNELRMEQLLKYLKQHIPFKVNSDDPGAKFQLRDLELSQFNWDEEENCVVVERDNIDDYRKCSYEGLSEIIYDHFPDMMTEYKNYVNSYILVLPIYSRLPSMTFDGSTRKLNNDELTTIYKNILYITTVYYPQTFTTYKSQYAKHMLNACVRRMISKLVSNVSSLLRPSKQNLARTMQSNRLPNSGRCTIVPAPDLRVDQVSIPRHLMYEVCREEFQKYLSDTLNIPMNEAKLIWRTEAMTEKIQNLFTDFVEGNESEGRMGKYVVINRAPTLYELGMMACKVSLNNDYVMRLPMALCKAFNAD